MTNRNANIEGAFEITHNAFHYFMMNINGGTKELENMLYDIENVKTSHG